MKILREWLDKKQPDFGKNIGLSGCRDKMILKNGILIDKIKNEKITIDLMNKKIYIFDETVGFTTTMKLSAKSCIDIEIDGATYYCSGCSFVENRNSYFLFKCNDIFVDCPNVFDLKEIDSIEIICSNIKEIFDNKSFTKSFSYEDFHFNIESCKIQMSSSNKKSYDQFSEIAFHLFDFLFILIGRYINFDRFDILVGTKIFSHYGDLAPRYFTNKEISCISGYLVNIYEVDIGSIFKQWIMFSLEYKQSNIGFYISQMQNNSYIDIQLSNIMQAIDGFMEVFLKNTNDELDKNKTPELISQVDSMIENIDLNESLTDDEKKSLKFQLENYKKYPNKQKLKKFIDATNEYDIFFEEQYLLKKYADKKSPCCIFLKYNHMLTKIIEERNKFSHMTEKENSISVLQTKNAYFKLLLTYRIRILQIMNVNILQDNVQNILNELRKIFITNYGKKECDNCSLKAECPFISKKDVV